MNTDIELIKKRDTLKTWLQILAIGAIGLAVAPIIFATIKGIVGLAIAAGIGVSLVMLAPVAALKLANLKYRLTEAENISHIKKVTESAYENPIETLTNLLQQKKAAYNTFKDSVETAIVARESFKNKVEKFSIKYPHRAPEFIKQLESMTELVSRKKIALADAKKTLEDGDLKLEEMKAYWEMSKDAIAANKAAGMDTGDAFEKLKADTACDAVFDSMNTAFAQLEIAAALNLDEQPQAVQQLTHTDPQVITLNVNESRKVKVQ